MDLKQILKVLIYSIAKILFANNPPSKRDIPDLALAHDQLLQTV